MEQRILLGEHDDHHGSLLPDHLPEVGDGVGHGALADDVGRVPGVVVHYARGVDVVRVGTIDKGVQEDPVMIVR